MRTRQSVGLAAMTVMLLASAGGVAAQENPVQSVKPSALIGSWAFQTEKYRDETCSMSGHMNIHPSTSATAFTCSFVAVEECAGADRWVVEQTCELNKSNSQVTISSQIVNFLESKEFTGSYAADHFVLSINSRQLMTGSLVSAVRAPVEFRREKENLS